MTYEITQDPYPEDPRKAFSQLCTMVCWHKRYALPHENPDIKEPADFWAFVKESDPEPFHLPVYMYDHSGLTVSTTPFSCPWDSGQIGWIYISPHVIEDNFGVLEPVELLHKAQELMEAEVEEWDMYLTGDVWVVSVEEDGDVIDCVGGVWGYEEAEEEADRMLRRWHQHEDLKQWKKVTAVIAQNIGV